jgi:hypothetical protein
MHCIGHAPTQCRGSNVESRETHTFHRPSGWTPEGAAGGGACLPSRWGKCLSRFYKETCVTTEMVPFAPLSPPVICGPAGSKAVA